jgi:FAD/FMN-containing dehydrogenase
MVAISSWGRISNDEHSLLILNDRKKIQNVIASSQNSLAYGNGRSYGDVCLNPNGNIWLTRGLDRFIEFDNETGVLRCESGVLLQDIQRSFVPRGWMLPVTPGTQLVTVGGAIANDIHGKNHHRAGSFGHHVLSINLIRTDGQHIICGPQNNVEWFYATIGGLGLTGFIAEVELKLKKVSGPWLDVETISYDNLEQFFSLADESEANWEHTVSWIDCMGSEARGIFMRANHSSSSNQHFPTQKSITMPIAPPISLVNKVTLKPFNFAYYHLNKLKAGKAIAHYEPFFYPLDNINEWNKMYGIKGFFQYQFVVPRDVGHDAVSAVLKEISNSKQGSFLAVLKTFGSQHGLGMLSFPQPGVTLALDFPNLGDKTQALFNRLDAIVQQANGRIYMAKDARMPKSLFETGYPKFREFMSYRDLGISSALSRRLMGY